MKPSLEHLDRAFKITEDIAGVLSDDVEKQVGAAVLHKWGIEVATANTFINGAEGLPNTRPDKYQYIIHAEANLVYEAARLGIPLDKKTIICTLSPCQNCIRTMFQAGIREIYYKDTYRAHDPNMLDIKVTEEPYGEYTYMCLTNHE